MAFVSNHRLFLSDPNGKNKQLIADASKVDPQIEDYYFHAVIDNPVFSPDGRTLAYAFDGLHLYDLATSEDEHVLTNLGNLLDEPFVFSQEVYDPVSWSPDGNQLLFSMSYYEGSTLGVMEPGESQPFRRLWSNGAVCCHYTWAMDSLSVVVANPYFTTNPPGMWRFDAEIGEEVEIIDYKGGNGSTNYAGWPFQRTSGSDLLFFYANIKQFSPDEGIPLQMVHSSPDGKTITLFREELFVPHEVLWADDGAYAIILGRCCGGDPQLFFSKTDGSPLEVLMEDAQKVRHITWGPQ